MHYLYDIQSVFLWHIAYLISVSNLHEDDIPGERNHAIQKNTCLVSFVHRSCSLFLSSSHLPPTVSVWNPFLRLFNVRWAKSSNDLWLDFSGKKDAQPKMFTLDFKQSMVLLLTHSQRVSHQIQQIHNSEQLHQIQRSNLPWK
jgi:hypothetical protein